MAETYEVVTGESARSHEDFALFVSNAQLGHYRFSMPHSFP